jgi:hypothetical protein
MYPETKKKERKSIKKFKKQKNLEFIKSLENSSRFSIRFPRFIFDENFYKVALDIQLLWRYIKNSFRDFCIF